MGVLRTFWVGDLGSWVGATNFIGVRFTFCDGERGSSRLTLIRFSCCGVCTSSASLLELSELPMSWLIQQVNLNCAEVSKCLVALGDRNHGNRIKNGLGFASRGNWWIAIRRWHRWCIWSKERGDQLTRSLSTVQKEEAGTSSLFQEVPIYISLLTLTSLQDELREKLAVKQRGVRQQQQPFNMERLRKKFLKTALGYMGVPYAQRYHSQKCLPL